MPARQIKTKVQPGESNLSWQTVGVAFVSFETMTDASYEGFVPADPSECVRRYAANAPFRSAEAHELVNEDNPFRRPVRPHDLGFLDFGRVLPREETLLLSALLGHRMLRNVYDADLLYLPAREGSPSRADGDLFYSAANRVNGEQAAVVLERHLFSFLPGERPDREIGSVGALKDLVLGELSERRSRPGAAFAAAHRCRGLREAATFVLLQLTSTLPAWRAALARNLAGDYDLAHPALRRLLTEDFVRAGDRSPVYRDLLGRAGLIAEPVAYWQFFLTTWLARANHLHRLSRNHELVGELFGAWTYQKIDDAVTANAYGALVAEAFGEPPLDLCPGGLTEDGLGEFFDSLVLPFHDRFGQAALQAFQAGFSDARTLHAMADDDLATQLIWADQLDEYKDKAEKLDHKIKNEGLEVDLETFVESSEETSTTHVHDDHRLVVVEVGQMHFWNNVGKKIPMSAGDKLLIPANRLHGSVVLSGTCTYHQPVISEELLRTV